MKPVRVMIVEDSLVVRTLLANVVNSDRRFELVSAVSSAEEALSGLVRLAPDVISLDIRLPGMNGLEATSRIMAERPTPIVVVAASVESGELDITMNALRAGALAVIEKPVGVEASGFREQAGNILTQLFIMSQVRVVRQWNRETRRTMAPIVPPKRLVQDIEIRALGIGCSTGGPNALAVLLRDLPAGLDVPILLVQHIPPTFVASFASWIASISSLPVRLVREPEVLKAGWIYIAASGLHLGVANGNVVGTAEPPAAQHPSADVLFRSMAREFGSAALGILLTGMGEDGAQGLLEMRRAGACTIAEDSSTAIVYGMPGAAMALGAVCESLPLQMIAPRIAELATHRVDSL
jgi:two-component system chemotaxis response regulator CheB